MGGPKSINLERFYCMCLLKEPTKSRFMVTYDRPTCKFYDYLGDDLSDPIDLWSDQIEISHIHKW
jgi:hypothetical protein